jgi:1-deoxy-D-xylulose-5-phosphate synthase
LEAAEALAADGVESMVINARFVKPLDERLICEAARASKRVVTVEENTLAGGFGGAILELFANSEMSDLRVERIGLPDEFAEQGPQATLRAKYDLDAEGIARRIRAAFPELTARERPLVRRGS